MIRSVLKLGAIIALGLIGVLLTATASAQRHGGWHGGGGGVGLWGLGLGLGLGWEIASVGRPYPYGYAGYPGYYGYYGYSGYPAYPAYSYAYPYPYPYAVASAPEPYPVPPQPAAQYAQPAASWYYCDSARGYYPYVAQCPEAWRAVPSVPPGTAR